MPIVICTTPFFTRGTITSVATSSGDDLSAITMPSGTQSGDVTYLFASAYSAYSPNFSPAPSGWTALYSALSSIEHVIWRRVWDTAPSGLDLGTTRGAWIAVSYRGVDSSAPEDVSIQNSSGASLSPNPPAITTITDNCRILVFGIGNVISTAPTYPSGYSSDQVFVTATSGEFGGASMMIASKTLASLGTEDPGSFGGPSYTSWAAFTQAIRPGIT
jgi:hypothetical protein